MTADISNAFVQTEINPSGEKVILKGKASGHFSRN